MRYGKFSAGLIAATAAASMLPFFSVSAQNDETLRSVVIRNFDFADESQTTTD